MANIVRWFEDFPTRALELLGSMKEVAKASNRIGSLSLLVAPALLVAPYERLQQYAKRKNPQADYLAFPEAHKAFDRVMRTPFGKAEFWKAGGGAGIAEWRASQVERITADPSARRKLLARRRRDLRGQPDELGLPRHASLCEDGVEVGAGRATTRSPAPHRTH